MTWMVPWLIWLVSFFGLSAARRYSMQEKLMLGAGLAGLILPYRLLRRGANNFDWAWCEALPRWFWLFAEFLYCMACFICLWVIFDWLIHALSVLFFRCILKRDIPAGGRHLFSRLPVIIPLSVILSVLGIYFSLIEPAVREYDIVIDKPGPAEFTIAAVSDLHFDPVFDHGYAARIVRKLNGLNADVIFLLGDYSNTVNGLTPEVLAELKKLHAPEGIYAVTGNHEYYPEGKHNFERLSSIGIPFLCNEHVRLDRSGIYLAGINDLYLIRKPYPGSLRRDRQKPSLGRAVKGIPKDSPVILLSHQPEEVKGSVKYRLDLQLSGHIHGGLFPVLHWLMEVWAGYTSGYYRLGKTQMVVSAGTGIWCGFPIRFGIMPEILSVRVKFRPDKPDPGMAPDFFPPGLNLP